MSTRPGSTVPSGTSTTSQSAPRSGKPGSTPTMRPSRTSTVPPPSRKCSPSKILVLRIATIAPDVLPTARRVNRSSGAGFRRSPCPMLPRRRSASACDKGAICTRACHSNGRMMATRSDNRRPPSPAEINRHEEGVPDGRLAAAKPRYLDRRGKPAAVRRPGTRAMDPAGRRRRRDSGAAGRWPGWSPSTDPSSRVRTRSTPSWGSASGFSAGPSRGDAALCCRATATRGCARLSARRLSTCRCAT